MIVLVLRECQYPESTLLSTACKLLPKSWEMLTS